MDFSPWRRATAGARDTASDGLGRRIGAEHTLRVVRVSVGPAALGLALAVALVPGCGLSSAREPALTRADPRPRAAPLIDPRALGTPTRATLAKPSRKDEGDLAPLAVDAATAHARASLPREERTQFVLLGMDTTPHWERRGFETFFHFINRDVPHGAPKNSYTLFIGSGGMQFDETRENLTVEERVFQGVLPRHDPSFRYAESLEQIRGKVENIRRLHELGVEIASHTVRHRRGTGWSRAEWDHELSDHQRILDLVGLPHPEGFRAPYLATSEHLDAALEAHGYRYDCSRGAADDAWPRRSPGTRVWRFGVASVRVPGRDAPALLYDLSLDRILRRSSAAHGVQGEAAVQAWMEDAFERAVERAFYQRYQGSRAPLLVSGHGGFRAPITRFMRRVCRMDHVRCATFREATDYMDAHPEMEGAR